MINELSEVHANLRQPLCNYLLAVADDKFLLGHRNGDWTGLGPFLEADIAFSNIAQDEIAHAQELYKLAVQVQELENPGLAAGADLTTETNALAYARPASERLCCGFVLPGDDFDWGLAVVRQCFFDHLDALRFERLQGSAFKPLADLAGKIVQEVRFHIDHFDSWVIKLGQGTAESKERLRNAVEKLWPLSATLFAEVQGQQELVQAGIVVDGSPPMHESWMQSVSELLSQAGNAVPEGLPLPSAAAQRQPGQLGAELQCALAEISEVYQLEPNAEW